MKKKPSLVASYKNFRNDPLFLYFSILQCKQNFIQILLNMAILVDLFKVIEVIKTSSPKDVQPTVLKEVQKGACHIIDNKKGEERDTK